MGDASDARTSGVVCRPANTPCVDVVTVERAAALLTSSAAMKLLIMML